MIPGPPSRIGPFEIVSRIGAGGMGEVFRARDVRLSRDVAIKVLPATFAHDLERVARFRREAQFVASLSHPNIAAIYGLEETDGVVALALELVDGEDLAEHLARGPIPIEDTIAIARQIAEGLEAAHEKGIIHRDLKPANIKLTKEGGVKILDFGLAKAYEGDPADPANSDLAHSPTMARPMTEAGMILGTAPYMSPEQARGKPVDKRSDIWSFGVVLFEMLTGRRLFGGETVSDTLAAVLRQEIDWSLLPKNTSPTLVSLLRRCLERQPSDRLRDIGEARIALRGAMAAPATQTAAERRDKGMRRWWFAAALILATAAASVITWRMRPDAPRRIVRASIALPPGLLLAFDLNSPQSLAISPDAKTIAFAAMADLGDPSGANLYLRNLDSAEFTLVPGSRAARSPFFSPDGKWVAFVAEGALKKVPVSGGSPTVIVPSIANAWGGAWLENGTILYTNFLASGEALFAVQQNGGNPQVVKRMEKLNEDYSFPYPLNEDEVLITRWLGGVYSDARIDRISLTDSAETPLLEGGSNAQLTESGFLVYARGSELFATAFDSRRRAPDGTPVSILRGVLADAQYGVPQFALSPTGTLLYAEGQKTADSSLTWVDSSGRSEPIASAGYLELARLSPDRRTIVYVGGEADKDIWSLDLATGRRLRHTTAKGEDYAPTVSADGRFIYFIAWRKSCEVRRVPIAGGSEEVLTRMSVNLDRLSFSADGRWIAIAGRPTQSSDIGFIDLKSGSFEVRWLLKSESTEEAPSFAPVGSRFAYVSNQSGRREVWVRAGIDDTETVVVSRDGGSGPFWSPDGKTLYFAASGKLMSASVAPSGPLAVGAPRVVMDTDGSSIVGVATDGRFLAHRRDLPKISQLEVVLNWDEELRSKLRPR